MQKLVSALFGVIIICSILAFKPVPPVNASVIVSLSKPISPAVVSEISGFGTSAVEALNPEQTLYKISYASDLMSYDRVAYRLSLLPGFSGIQKDERVYLRSTTPNDSLYASQWHLPRIQAPQAWDSSTTTGITKNGDTIVVAVIDDGLHVNHPDFTNNIWINRGEIKGNNIDDDNNGFKDDYYGWNFMGRNNDISDSTNYNATHGTRVAGIIGATGNNTKGACGVMWHLKMMIVNIADTSSTALPGFAFQSDVLRAYSYVLHQRKLYNSSNGTKGAYVVAINSSWGVDNRLAAHAPLWCAFYDTLGKYGVLTAAATRNDASDVETAGDLPSLCTSKHVIITSAVNSIDKYSNRGYGTTSVDLSAPGEGIVTTLAYTKMNRQNNNLYGTMSGTSAATPMVAATIAMLHNQACKKFLDTMKANPAKANLLLRRFILEGVDTLPDLVGKSATAGRLNVYRSLQVMQKYCDGTLGLKQPALKNKISMYPNPGAGQLTILCDKEIIMLKCLTVTGQEIQCPLTDEVMDTSGLAPGVYYIAVTTVNGTSVLPYVKLAE